MRQSNPLRLLVTALYFAVLNWMLLVPAGMLEDIPRFFPHEDKVAHFLLFLSLAWLARWSAPPSLRRGAVVALAGALLLYAGAIEILQPVLGGAGREFDLLDMAGNLAGTAAGWLLYGLVPPPAAAAGDRARRGEA